MPSLITNTEKRCPIKQITLLLGNKSDLALARQVSVAEGEELAKTNKMIFFKSSARDGSNVKLAFEMLTAGIIKRFVDPSISVTPQSACKDSEADVDPLCIKKLGKSQQLALFKVIYEIREAFDKDVFVTLWEKGGSNPPP